MSLIDKNRRIFFKFVATSVGIATFGVTQASAKASKDVANYIETPKNGEKCLNCLHFEKETNTCAIIKGKVTPEAWCKFYVSENHKKN